MFILKAHFISFSRSQLKASILAFKFWKRYLFNFTIATLKIWVYGPHLLLTLSALTVTGVPLSPVMTTGCWGHHGERPEETGCLGTLTLSMHLESQPLQHIYMIVLLLVIDNFLFEFTSKMNNNKTQRKEFVILFEIS